MISTYWSSKWWSYSVFFRRSTNVMVSWCTLTLGLSRMGSKGVLIQKWLWFVFRPLRLVELQIYFVCFPLFGGRWNPFWLICFKWVGSTTKLCTCLVSRVQKSRFWSRNWTVFLAFQSAVCKWGAVITGIVKSVDVFFGLKARGTTIVIDFWYYVCIMNII